MSERDRQPSASPQDRALPPSAVRIIRAVSVIDAPAPVQPTAECRARGPARRPATRAPRSADRSGRPIAVRESGPSHLGRFGRPRRATAGMRLPGGRGVRARGRSDDRRGAERHDRAGSTCTGDPRPTVREPSSRPAATCAHGERAEGRHRRGDVRAVRSPRRRPEDRTAPRDGPPEGRQPDLVTAGDGVLPLPYDHPALALRPGVVRRMRTVGSTKRRLAVRSALRLRPVCVRDPFPRASTRRMVASLAFRQV